MNKNFYEYSNLLGYPLINRVTYPHCPMGEEPPNVFLVYAENETEAFKLAMAHIYGGKSLKKFYGIYKEEKYDGEFECLM